MGNEDDLSLLTLPELAARIESHHTAIRYTRHSRDNEGRTRETIKAKLEFADKLVKEADELEEMLSKDSVSIIEGHSREIDRCNEAKLVVQLHSVGVIAEASKLCNLSEENIKKVWEIIGK